MAQANDLSFAATNRLVFRGLDRRPYSDLDLPFLKELLAPLAFAHSFSEKNPLNAVSALGRVNVLPGFPILMAIHSWTDRLFSNDAMIMRSRRFKDARRGGSLGNGNADIWTTQLAVHGRSVTVQTILSGEGYREFIEPTQAWYGLKPGRYNWALEEILPAIRKLYGDKAALECSLNETHFPLDWIKKAIIETEVPVFQAAFSLAGGCRAKPDQSVRAAHDALQRIFHYPRGPALTNVPVTLSRARPVLASLIMACNDVTEVDRSIRKGGSARRFASEEIRKCPALKVPP